jgi:hypothetical protein
MKDIIITQNRIKKELTVLLVCLIVGVLANIGAIIYYKTSFAEVFTSLHYVFIFAIALYALWSFIRCISIPINRILKK